MTDKTFLIVNSIPNHQDMISFKAYISQIVEIFHQFGGVGIARFKTMEQVMGNGGIQSVAIFEFPNAQAIHDMMSSSEFNALNELRKKAFQQSVDLMICSNS